MVTSYGELVRLRGAEMTSCPRLLLSWLLTACTLVAIAGAAELPDYPDDTNNGIPVNYTEANVGEYQLPDPLLLDDGTQVTTAEQWRTARREQLRRQFERYQYGRAAAGPMPLDYEVVESSPSALNGTAVRKQVVIRFGDTERSQFMDLLLYLPAHRQGPVPVLLSINFMPNNLSVDDDAVRVGRIWNRETGQREPATRPSRFGRLPVAQVLAAGFGLATFNYADVDPDAKDGFSHGVRSLYAAGDPSEMADDEWGTIAAWVWGISRAIDYFEQDADVDEHRVAITGISRLGKTVMWAGANDERVAAVIASCSGEGGAALSRRNYGETIAHLASPKRYSYQFAKNYQTWAADPRIAPVDAHELVALIAPRPLLLQTGTSDKWSDPKGEFLAAQAATPVYELLGQQGINVQELPEPNTLVGDTLAFYMHDGGHGMVPGDWQVFLEFLTKQFQSSTVS
ncbi:MAG: hypothetical protein KDB23_20495, partial [Planctomycetales bacterium]|nr:hypothetical protein [Planctomycetales bacterium]